MRWLRANSAGFPVVGCSLLEFGLYPVGLPVGCFRGFRVVVVTVPCVVLVWGECALWASPSGVCSWVYSFLWGSLLWVGALVLWWWLRWQFWWLPLGRGSFDPRGGSSGTDLYNSVL